MGPPHTAPTGLIFQRGTYLFWHGQRKLGNSKLFSAVVRERQGFFFVTSAFFKMLLVTFHLFISSYNSAVLKHAYGYISTQCMSIWIYASNVLSYTVHIFLKHCSITKRCNFYLDEQNKNIRASQKEVSNIKITEAKGRINFWKKNIDDLDEDFVDLVKKADNSKGAVS